MSTVELDYGKYSIEEIRNKEFSQMLLVETDTSIFGISPPYQEKKNFRVLLILKNKTKLNEPAFKPVFEGSKENCIKHMMAYGKAE